MSFALDGCGCLFYVYAVTNIGSWVNNGCLRPLRVIRYASKQRRNEVCAVRLIMSYGNWVLIF